MRKRHFILLFVACLIFVFSQAANAQQSAPYLYYYSDKENAFIVERADGTDRQLFAKNVTPRQKDPLGIDGPGWSPDGKWFAWRSVYYADGRVHFEGHLIRTGNPEPETLFRYIENLYSMYWSPNSQYLLTYLNPAGCSDISGYCNSDTYWLVDVTAPRLAVRSIFDIRQEREPIGVEWAADKGEVNLYIWEGAWGQVASYLKITMHDDGRVEKLPISQENWKANTPPDDFSSATDDKLFTSSSGRYNILVTQRDIIQIKDTQTGKSIPVPKSQFGSRDPVTLKQPVWSTSEEWVMGGYIDFNGLWGVGVFKTDGTGYREITICAAEPSPACAGWLPENVDVSKIASAS